MMGGDRAGGSTGVLRGRISRTCRTSRTPRLVCSVPVADKRDIVAGLRRRQRSLVNKKPPSGGTSAATAAATRMLRVSATTCATANQRKSGAISHSRAGFVKAAARAWTHVLNRAAVRRQGALRQSEIAPCTTTRDRRSYRSPTASRILPKSFSASSRARSPFLRRISFT